MEETKRRGGRREGAGRKPGEVKKVTVTFSMSPDVVEILRTYGRQQSAYIEKLVRDDQQRNE